MITFARTRHNYDSYLDFWKLVDLSGFHWVWLDQIEPESDNTYIFTPHNGQFLELVAGWGPRWTGRKCKVVWWCLERPDGNAVPFRDSVDSVVGQVDAAWVSDRYVSTLHPFLTHAVLGSHAGLRETLLDQFRTFDFAHMSYAWGRRADLYAAIRAQGLTEAPNAFGLERSQILARTKIMVNAQQYQTPVVAPLRFAIAAAHKMTVLTERAADSFPYENAVIQSDYASIPTDAHILCTSPPSNLEAIGIRLYELLCGQITFKTGVIDALQRSGLL